MWVCYVACMWVRSRVDVYGLSSGSLQDAENKINLSFIWLWGKITVLGLIKDCMALVKIVDEFGFVANFEVDPLGLTEFLKEWIETNNDGSTPLYEITISFWRLLKLSK